MGKERAVLKRGSFGGGEVEVRFEIRGGKKNQKIRRLGEGGTRPSKASIEEREVYRKLARERSLSSNYGGKRGKGLSSQVSAATTIKSRIREKERRGSKRRTKTTRGLKRENRNTS